MENQEVNLLYMSDIGRKELRLSYHNLHGTLCRIMEFTRK